ncbi:hypothetical protein [Hymenobacter wooponensis]|uniref:Uncharacterized protein n=1 Tax=Hymenobacter wooponensis TaxID=1525360 RepID=A0A4Z0MJ56_9BACT|nr:hypothetical protein [Hymenobacter wooponensis]TGD79546.1 hypothetical protein EU557_15085 [Hymenobacter wooponensis]
MTDTSPQKIAKLALSYFQAPQPYFWQWAENGEIIEWTNGTTICYREELALLLKDMAPNGLPSLSTLLLVLAACTDAWVESTDGLQCLRRLLSTESTAPQQTESLDAIISEACKFLSVVAALPVELRKGPKKLQLLQEIFAQEYHPLPAEWAKSTLDEWTSGRLDLLLLEPGPLATAKRLNVELALLGRAFNRFPTPEALALRLRTGLDQLPLPLEQPVLPPTPEVVDILSELAQDTKTAGLARLTQRLVAALHIPLHTQGTSDQPFGGVSDVSNRGSFDRLLLSELAYDDLALTARLVNNEALYLRREEPPHQEQPQRVLLLDTTLRMWGVPRVFALAAALACAQPRRQPVGVSAFALGGSQSRPLTLTTKAGVVEALSHLDPALHCGGALQSFVQEQAAAPLAEYILVTDAQLTQQPEFVLLLADMKPKLRFLLTVDRSGELQLHEFTKAGRVLLSTTRYDLEELLFAKPLPLKHLNQWEQPAFLTHTPAPLYFPTCGLRPGMHNTFQHSHLGVIGVTDTLRVLYWPRKQHGARELLPFIASSTYVFGFDGDSTVFLIVNDKQQKLLHYHRLCLLTETVETVDFSAELQFLNNTLEVYFTWPRFIVRIDDNACIIDCPSNTVVRRTYFDQSSKPTSSLLRPDFYRIKQHINNGYTVLHKINRIAVDSIGFLAIEGHSLRLVTGNQDRLRFANKTKDGGEHHVTKAEAEPLALPPYARVLFRHFIWADGSEAIADGRGLLHLRSSDAELPEITVVLALGQATAAWASDGRACGASYFTGPATAQHLPAPVFYETYIQRFISRLSA